MSAGNEASPLSCHAVRRVMIVEGRMIDVESWEQIRRAYYIEQKSMREIGRETGHAWRTVKRIIESGEPSKYVGVFA